jgi:hypothetical protein
MSILQQFNSDGGFVTTGNVNAANVVAQYLFGDGSNITGIGNGGGSGNTIYNGLANVTIPTANGNVLINTVNGLGNAWQWRFGTNGALTIPEAGNTAIGSITTATGSNHSIIVHPDGTGKVIIKGDASPMLTVGSDTVDNPMQMVVQSFGNSLGNSGGGTYVGQYLRLGTPLVAGDRLVALSGKGSYDGVNYSNIPAGRIQIMAANTWSSTSTPTYVSILNTPEGSTTQVENMRIEPNGNVNIYNGNIISRGAYITGADDTGSNAFYAGVSGFTQLISNVVGQFTANVNSYGQINFQNISTGSAASADFILEADNATEYTHFFDMGITSSTWDGSQPNSLGTAISAGDGYLWAQDGNVRIATTVGNAAPYVLSLTTDGDVIVPAQNVSGSQGESALFRGTRRIVNGQYSGATYGYSAVLAAGGTPTVAYTATNEYVQSVRLTFAVESVGTASQWEQFDIVVTKSLDTPGTVNFVVSNRIKGRASIADTTVTATINLANEIEISLNLDAAQTSGWSSFDAVEFGVMFN